MSEPIKRAGFTLRRGLRTREAPPDALEPPRIECSPPTVVFREIDFRTNEQVIRYSDGSELRAARETIDREFLDAHAPPTNNRLLSDEAMGLLIRYGISHGIEPDRPWPHATDETAAEKEFRERTEKRGGFIKWFWLLFPAVAFFGAVCWIAFVVHNSK